MTKSSVNDLQLTKAPIVKAGMLIRKPVVNITNSGFDGDGDRVVAQALDSTGGFTIVLDGAKAWLEHNINLNLIEDKFPKGLTEH